MENASKALIIAGAILLSILIIALGIFIYNQARGAINVNTLDSQTINAFNSPIAEYEGSSLGSNLRSLISNLISQAGTYAGSADYLVSVTLNDSVTLANSGIDGVSGNKIEAVGGETAAAKNDDYIDALTKIRSALVNSHYYEVSVQYGASGLISQVTIDYNTSTSGSGSQTTN